MKKSVYVLIVTLILISACASSKKSEKTNFNQSISHSLEDSKKESGKRLEIDTTKFKDLTFTFTEMEFSIPSVDASTTEEASVHPSLGANCDKNKSLVRPDAKKPPSENLLRLKQLSIGMKTLENGKASVSDSSTTETKKEKDDKRCSSTENAEERNDCFLLRYPFISIVVIGIFLYLIRSPILRLFRKISSIFCGNSEKIL